MKDFFKLVLILTLICTISGILLAFVDQATKQRIQEAERFAKADAINKVLPPHDNIPAENTCTFKKNGVTWTFYVARNKGLFAGAAFEARSSKGYGGDIVITAGVDSNGVIQAIEILDHRETPGLGANIMKPEFKSKLAGKNIFNAPFSVRKDGGDVDQITAATISSRAVLEAVNNGLNAYKEHIDSIRTQGEQL